MLRISSNHTLRKQANRALCYFGMFLMIHGGSIDVLRIITNHTLGTIECTGQCSIVVLLTVVRMHGCYIDGLRILNHHTVMTLDLYGTVYIVFSFNGSLCIYNCDTKNQQPYVANMKNIGHLVALSYLIVCTYSWWFYICGTGGGTCSTCGTGGTGGTGGIRGHCEFVFLWNDGKASPAF